MPHSVSAWNQLLLLSTSLSSQSLHVSLFLRLSGCHILLDLTVAAATSTCPLQVKSFQFQVAAEIVTQVADEFSKSYDL